MAFLTAAMTTFPLSFCGEHGMGASLHPPGVPNMRLT